MAEKCISRRAFVKAGGSAMAVAAVASTGIMQCNGGSVQGGTPYTFDLDSYPELATVGGSAYVVYATINNPAIVVRTGPNDVTAFSSVCTHQGCRINLPGENGIAQCPCHESMFDTSGKLISGPARNQPVFPAVIEGTTLTLTI